MKVSILGSGDISRIARHTSLNENEVLEMVHSIAKLLVEKGHEIIIIPDKGVSVEIAKKYKSLGGRKVYGVIPVNDKKYGIKHIQDNLTLIDEQIKVNDWYNADGEIAANGDVCIVLGLGGGVLREVAVLKYHYKYLDASTKLVMFENAMSSRLHPELEEDLGNNLVYINTMEELEELL